MPARMGDPQIERTPAVSQRGTTAPPGSRGTWISRTALPGHQHQAKIGDGIRLILLCRPQKQETGPLVVSRASEPVETHKTHIKQTNRKPCAGSLMVVGSRTDQVLAHTSPSMKHGPVIVRCCNMSEIGGAAHHIGTTKKGVAASTRGDQGNCFLKQSHPIHHGTYFIERSKLG